MVGIRPEHVTLREHEPDERTIDAETLFMEPMGADTLGWFQLGEHRLSARLVPQVARGLSGRVRLSLLSDHISLFDPIQRGTALVSHRGMPPTIAAN